MNISTQPSTQRVNPSELRKARALFQATMRDCKRMALQAVLTAGMASYGEDWKEEVRVLELEEQAKDARPVMRAVSATSLQA